MGTGTETGAGAQVRVWCECACACRNESRMRERDGYAAAVSQPGTVNGALVQHPVALAASPSHALPTAMSQAPISDHATLKFAGRGYFGRAS